MELRDRTMQGPYSIGEPENEDESTTVLDRHGEPMTAEQIVADLNSWRAAFMRAAEQDDPRDALIRALKQQT